MDSHSLDLMIAELFDLLEDRKSLLSFSGTFVSTPTEVVGFERHDWRPVWAKCKEIQSEFSAKVRYPTRQERDAAWTRFNNLRNEASSLANAERDKFERMSEHYRDLILFEIKYARYSPVTDILFFFDPTNVEDMKEKSRMLTRAGTILSENKERMSKEHKNECFGRIQEARETHQLFWQQRKAAMEQRQEEWQARHRQHMSRAEANISKNEDRLAKQQEALERVEAQIEDLEGKVDEARSDEWRDRFSDWLETARDKRRSILEGIERTSEWLDQDRERLASMEKKLR